LSVQSIIRQAAPSEDALLSALALRSKGYWGYDAEFLDACRGELTISPAYIAAHPVYVIEERGRIVGFYTLLPAAAFGVVELDYLYVDPSAIKSGHGKKLWEHAIRTASELGFQRLTIQSDPYAESFYLKMGAERIGAKPSAVRADRMLPLLSFSLSTI